MFCRNILKATQIATTQSATLYPYYSCSVVFIYLVLLLITLLGGLQQARRPLRVRAGAAAAHLAAGVAPARVDRRDRRAER